MAELFVVHAPSKTQDAPLGKSFVFIPIVVRNAIGTLLRAASPLSRDPLPSCRFHLGAGSGAFWPSRRAQQRWLLMGTLGDPFTLPVGLHDAFNGTPLGACIYDSTQGWRRLGC